MSNAVSMESVLFSNQLIYMWTFGIQPISKLGAACKVEVHKVEVAAFDWFSILWLCYSKTSHILESQ